MVSFELVKEIEKDVLSTRHERGTRESPHEESNLRPSDFGPQCSTTEPQRLKNELTKFIIRYDSL